METKIYFDLKDLMGIAMLLVVTGIGVSYGLQVNADIKNDMIDGSTNCTSATDSAGCGEEFIAANQSVNAVAKIPAKMGTIVTIVLAAIVIGILIRYLWVKFG